MPHYIFFVLKLYCLYCLFLLLSIPYDFDEINIYISNYVTFVTDMYGTTNEGDGWYRLYMQKNVRATRMTA